MADSDTGFSIEGWDEFVDAFASLVDKWQEKKKILLERMGNIYHAEIIPHVPVDTSRLVDNIFVFGEGISQDFIEVGTNVNYALFVNDGHVQHRRFLPAERLSAGGKAKYLKNGGKGIMLSERYVQGAFFMEKGFTDATPRLERLINSFMVQIKREVEGGSL
ncbi:HK97 gp10 family phage protein [Lachnospiraceae bacterium OttesenSCG-928-D06]|nr:HK97 gp10 family phage protein [Lachnospiraceae bacterium OttesenSCG-928-D06]